MLAGDPYVSADPELDAATLRAQELLERINASSVSDPDARHTLLTELLGSLGPDTELRPPLRCDYGTHLHIGSRTFVNVGLVALDCAEIRIGDDVQIGPDVQLLTPTHPLDPEARRNGWEGAQPITIEDNVWLGGGVIVLPGVTIGADSVIGAGAVVSRDIPSGVLALGVPARVVRSL